MKNMPLIDEDPPSTRPRAHVHDAPVHVRLGLADIAPGERRIPERAHHSERHADHQAIVAAARLHQQHANLRILAQSIGEHAARRAGADDDVVVRTQDSPTVTDLTSV